MRGIKTKVICLTTGEVFDSLGDANLKYGISNSKLSMNLRGKIACAGKLEDGTTLTWEYFYEGIDYTKWLGQTKKY